MNLIYIGAVFSIKSAVHLYWCRFVYKFGSSFYTPAPSEILSFTAGSELRMRPAPTSPGSGSSGLPRPGGQSGYLPETYIYFL